MWGGIITGRKLGLREDDSIHLSQNCKIAELGFELRLHPSA